ncbi:hypothetical protein G6F57_016320 [Rhizopus arrhizus]|nr:hypothetical protein G6F57_016320 [Rhizopus arrhizus]
MALHQFLTATYQMALDQHTDDALFAVFQLNGDVLDHLRLVVRVLQAVGVAGIDHQAGRQLGLGQRLAGLGNAACVVVRLLAAAQDHMAVRIAGGRDDGGAALLGDRQEMMRIGGSPHRVSSDLDVAIGAVLEADRARQPRGQFAVHLAFGGARTNRAPGHQVGDVLRRDHIEEFDTGRQAKLVDVAQQATGDAQALVDPEAAVQGGVVDQALPAHRGARLLEVHAHDDFQFAGQRIAQWLQALGVLDGRMRIVDRARAHHHRQAVITALQELVQGRARGADGV